MEISVNNMLESITNLSNKVTEYKEKNEKISFEFQSMFSVWINGVADQFSSRVTESEIEAKKLVVNMENLIAILKREITKLKPMGNNIQCNIDSKTIIMTKYNNVVMSLSKALKYYQNLGDLSFYPKRNWIENQRTKITEEISHFEELRKETEHQFTLIQKIEKNLSQELDRLKVEKITYQTELSGKINESRDTSIFEIESIEQHGKKILAFLKEQAITIEMIEKEFINIIQFYQSTNSKRLEETITDIKKSLDENQLNYFYYHKLIEENCDAFRQLKITNISNIERMDS